MVESNISTRPFWEATLASDSTLTIFSRSVAPSGSRRNGSMSSTAPMAACAKCLAPALSMNSRERSATVSPW